MITFIMLTGSFFVALMLSYAVTMTIMLNRKVLMWYTKRVTKMSEEMIETMFTEDE